MKTRTTNQEACPKHQKQVHEKKRQNILWKQRNISNKFEVKKRLAFKGYVTGTISTYNAEIEEKVCSGLLDEEKGDIMKEEFARKMGNFIQMWTEDGEKNLKDKIEGLLSTKEETEPEEKV